MEEQKDLEENANQKTRPTWANEFIACWLNKDKNGKEYVSVKLFGQYYNLFAVPKKNKPLET